MKSVWLLLAQGFGAGRLPAAPGTFGSVVGIGWFLLLLWPGQIWIFAVGILAGIWLSIESSTHAERLLGHRDPGSVVVDEICAMPLCFAGWVIGLWLKTGAMPEMQVFILGGGWKWSLGIFVAFRIFDIAKPWPIRQSQQLWEGWGVTVDDVLAAVYVNAVVGIGFWVAGGVPGAK